MRRAGDRDERASRIASGWTVAADPAAPASERITGADAEAGADRPASAATADAGADPTAEPRAQLSSTSLVLLGVIGGLYLLYTWVWFSWANYYSQVNASVVETSGVIGGVLQQIVFWAAPFAPVLWFFAVLRLLHGARRWKIALWLLIGAVVLVPLPMFDFGAAS